MSAQVDWLDSGAYARATDPSTSAAAAASVQVPDLEHQVRLALLRCPAGLTSYELADRLGLSVVTVSPRLRPLVGKGLVIDSGERREGDSGRKRIVWKATNTPTGAVPVMNPKGTGETGNDRPAAPIYARSVR